MKVEGNKLYSTSFKKILKQAHKDGHSLASHLLLDNSISEKTIHHVTFRSGTEVLSFCPHGKEQAYSDEGGWIKKGRQEVKIGKGLRMILKETVASQIPDAWFEKLVNYIKAADDGETDKTYEIVEVTGKDVQKYYHENSYSYDNDGGARGVLWNSCMRNIGDRLAMYGTNPDKISMAVMLMKKPRIPSQPNRIVCARALLLKTDQGVTVMDRIYSMYDHEVDAMKKWARNNGYWYKDIQSRNSWRGWVNNEGKKVERSFNVSGLKIGDYVPYMDTFCYINKKLGVLSNDYRQQDIEKAQQIKMDYSCQNTECIPQAIAKLIYCDLSSTYENEAHVVKLNYEGFSGYAPSNMCVRIREGGNAFIEHTRALSVPNATYCLIKNAVQDCFGSWSFNGDLLPLSDVTAKRYGRKEGELCNKFKPGVITINGKIYFDQDVYTCSYDGHYFPRKDVVLHRYGKYDKNNLPASIKREMEQDKKNEAKKKKSNQAQEALQEFDDMMSKSESDFFSCDVTTELKFPACDNGSNIKSVIRMDNDGNWVQVDMDMSGQRRRRTITEEEDRAIREAIRPRFNDNDDVW